MKCYYFRNTGFIFKILKIKRWNILILTEYKHIKEWAIFCVNIANIDHDLDNTRVKSSNNKINNIYSLFS